MKKITPHPFPLSKAEREKVRIFKMKYLVYIFSILITAALPTLSQTTIRGVVSDAATNQRLKDVTVYLSDFKKAVSTNDSGEFKLSGLPGGHVRLEFSLLGYKNFDLTVETDKPTPPLDIKLIPTEITTEEIIVTETNVQKPYQTDKIKAKDLQRYAAMNVSEAVTKIPGVWQLSTGTGVSKPDIRGLYGDRIGIMINGIRFDNQQWQDEHGLVMSSDGIDNIEVIKGPRSLLYGPEAIGGVVSITNEHPAPIGKNIADLNLKFFSNTLGILGDIGMKGAARNFNWLIRFGGETHADYLDGNGDRIPETRFGGYTIKSSLGYNKSFWVGTLDYSYTSYTYGILEGREFQRELMNINETRFDRSFSGPHHALKVHNAVFQNTFITGESKFKLNLGYTYNRRQEIEGADERFLPDSLQFGDLDMILNTSSYDGSWNYTFNKNLNITLASQGFIQTNINSGARKLIPDADVTSLSGTGMLSLQKDRFGLEAGLRFDMLKVKTTESGVKDSIDYFPQLDLTYNSVNGAAGATYKIDNFITLKANFSTGFRAPNPAELTSNGLHEGVFQFEQGNKDFKSEQSLEGDLGLVLDSKLISADISAFNNRINNYIYLGQTSDTLRGYPVFRYHQSNANLNGLEADVTVKPLDWLSLRGTYSTVIAKRSDGVNLPLIPADRITGSIHAELKNWKFFRSPYVELSTQTTLKKTRLGENETSLPGYTLLNADFGFDLRFEKQLINVSVSCNNLLNKVYIDFMSRIKVLSATYGDKTFYANNMGRNIVMAVKMHFFNQLLFIISEAD
jgi:iron complex outermembrane receptor protein